MEIAEFLEQRPRGDLWIFGYGSLMWSPGFRYTEKQTALVRGYHRALCILSSRYRGTPEKPGLVMGLCRGGSCWGMVFRVPAARVPRVLATLWKREMLNKVYKPTLIRVTAAPRRRHGAARRLRALAFVADTAHRQFVKELDLHGRARLVAQGIGQRGRCVDYIRNTLEHMLALGVSDPHLARVLDLARDLAPEGKPA
jgi:cation transport protein ChaC